MVSLILLSLLASRELVYPFSWQQQGLVTEVNGSIFKRCVQEDFQMSGCLARWKVFHGTDTQALWHTSSATVAHWTYPPHQRRGCEAAWAAAWAGWQFSSPRISIRREKHPQQFPFLMELRCWTETQIRLYTKRARSGHEKGIFPSLWEVVTSCLLEQAWILSSNLVPFPRLLHALQFA